MPEHEDDNPGADATASMTASSSTQLPPSPKKGRKTAPPVYNKTRGSKEMALEIAADAEARRKAMGDFEKDTRSAGDTSRFNKLTWITLHVAWWAFEGVKWAAWPLTPEKIAGVGALLKASGYRSAYNYLTAAKDEHIALGWPWTDQLARAAKLFNLSTARGIGPSKQSEPLDFRRCMLLDLGTDAVITDGPIGTMNLIVLLTYFLLRELEGAMAMWADITINTAAQTITWLLPVSKTDPMAKGCERTWGCLCGPFSVACPYHAAVAQDRLLRETFPQHAERRDIPWFPTATGQHVTATVMLALVEWIATAIGEPLKTKAGARRYGKHSWRSTGAVWLTSQRVELFRVQLLARWASSVIVHYARLAPLHGLTEHVK